MTAQVLAMNMPLQTVKSGKVTAKMGNNDGLVSTQDNLLVFTGVTYQDHVDAYKQLKDEVDGRQWVMGQIAASIDSNYGEAKLEKFAKEVGEKYNTLREYRRVYRKFENAKRLSNVPWSVYQVAASATEPDAIIEAVVKDKLSVRQVAQIVAHEEAEQIDIDNFMASGLSEGQQIIWEEYQRAARGIKGHLPFLREAIEDHIDTIKAMIVAEIDATPDTLSVRILKIINEGFDRLDLIVGRLVIRPLDDPENSRRVDRYVCKGLLNRLVERGLIKEKHKPRNHEGQRGAEAKGYRLTAAGEDALAAAG